MCWTGLRHGELKALAWEDVDLDKGTIHVKYNLTHRGNLKNVKTKASVRIVELLPAAIKVLKELRITSRKLHARDEIIHFKNQKTKTVKRGRVFLSRGDEPYLRPELTTAPKQWERWLREAKISYRPAYQLRHTYASQMLMVGAEVGWLAPQMGHSDTSMLNKIYGKWISDERPDYIKELASKLGQTYEEKEEK